MQSAKVILLCTVAAATYGVAHDQITVRVCPAYFVVAHPPYFPTSNLTVLAFCWGIASSAWLGAILGVLLALVTHSGGERGVSGERLVRGVITLLGVMTGAALAAGVIGYNLAHYSLVPLPTSIVDAFPADQRDRFVAVWFAHIASYGAAILGGLALINQHWRERGRPTVLRLYPATAFGAARVATLCAIVGVIIYVRVRGS